MIGPRRPIRPNELDEDAGQLPEALAMGHALEAWADRESTGPSPDFTDRVMAVVEAEPQPRPARAAVAALGAGRIGDFAASVRDAWRVAFGPSRPLATRVPALVLVLVVAIAAASVGGVATVGALELLTPDARPSPSPSVPPSPTPTLSPSPTPTLSPSPSPSPSPTATDEGTPEPTETAEPTDTAEPTETPGSGGDNSGPGSGGDDSSGPGPGG